MEALKKLSAISGGMGAQSGDPSGLPPNSFSPFQEGGGQPPQGAQPGGPPGAAAGAAGSPLAGMDPNMLKSILQRIFGGQGSGAPAFGGGPQGPGKIG